MITQALCGRPIAVTCGSPTRLPVDPCSYPATLQNFIPMPDGPAGLIPSDVQKPIAACGFFCHGIQIEGPIGFDAGSNQIVPAGGIPSSIFTGPPVVNPGTPGFLHATAPEPPPLPQQVAKKALQMQCQAGNFTQNNTSTIAPLLALAVGVFIIACIIK